MKLDESIKKYKNSLAGAGSTSELFERNEANANMMVATMCLLFCIIHLIGCVLSWAGLFEITQKEALIAGFIPAVLLGYSYVLCRKLKGKGKWLKYWLIGIVLFTCCINDYMLNFSVTITMVIPVLASIRYFNKKLTTHIAILTALLFGISSYLHTRFDARHLDLNYIGFKEGVQLIYHHSPIQTVLDTGFNRDAYTYFYMTENYLPKLLLFIFIATFSVLIAGKGHQMVLEEEKISTENTRIEEELRTAAQIQASMLNTDYPDNDSYCIFAGMTPAKEVGGDFYDFFELDYNHIAIVMADVSGKGVPAALFMARAKTLLLENVDADEDLGKAFSIINNKLCQNNDNGLFVTAFTGILDITTGELRYVNAGHELPFIYSRKNNEFKPHNTKHGFVLGGMEGIKFKEGEPIMLEPGDKLFQYTDGVTEATNARNELFGMERLEDSLNKHSNDDPEKLLHNIKADVDSFVGEAPQFDDLTMLCIEFKCYQNQG